MTNKPTRVQLVDDHAIVRAGLRQLLAREADLLIVAESESGKQALRDFEQHQPDIVIMDISLPDISGLEVMRRILRSCPCARILMLSMHAGLVATRAMQMGASGFICKRSGVHYLVTAIREIARGRRYLDAESGAEADVAMARDTSSALASLSKREMEVCMLLIEGKPVGEIAGLLHLSDKTIYTHRKRILAKLGAATDVELLQTAARLGISADARR